MNKQVGKKMENNYSNKIYYVSTKQSGWEYYEKFLSKQGRFSVFRVVKKNFQIVKRSCSLNYRVIERLRSFLT